MTPSESIKIVIRFQRRRDGGLRVWSDDVPGLVLSHADPARVVADIIPAVETIMSEVLGYPVHASELIPARSVMPTSDRATGLGERLQGMAGRLFPRKETREYAAAACPAQMIRDRWLSRSDWEKKLRRTGAEPLAGKGALNTAEWWRRPGKPPFSVPVEDDGRADFWAIDKIFKDQSD